MPSMLNQVPRKNKVYTEKGVRARLVAAAILTAAGCLLFGWVMSVPNTKSGGAAPMAIILFAILIGVAIGLFIGYQKGRRRISGFKTGKPLIFAAITIAALGLLGAIAIPGVPAIIMTARNNELNGALQKYVTGDEWSLGASLPDNPRFVMYDMEKKKFFYPENVGLTDYSFAYSNYRAKSPDEANIAIAYQEGKTGVGGAWYDKKTGEKVQDQYVANATIYAIRLDDWSLIDSKEVSLTLQKGSSNTTAISMVKAYDIDYLCENGKFEKK